ncbi:cation:proton antiporter [Microbacterium sp. ASV81]|uniref:Cation:proton antiporter n=1 Tax=Microbacterium capsulatum TaxID=3041921 RepID=A0ABU0XIH6_9MICO|nr:cation:proton antiporter [Microbacterium sp. ASV81]MDQ4214921.1 cation:proton antiporter [Microbacterium sp. ASV81]
MSPLVLVGLVAVLLWSLVAHRFERWGVAGPAALLVLGAAAIAGNIPAFASAIDTEASEKVVEVILAIILFVDATEVRGGGIFGGEGRVTLRLVLIALPLSLILAVVVAVWMIPESIVVILALVCVIMPTDFAPAARILRLAHVPPRVRQILNVESGYNDGLISPIFAMSLAISVALTELVRAHPSEQEKILTDGLEKIADAFVTAVPASVVAIAVGIVLGFVFGWAVRVLHRRGFANDAGIRFVMLLLPLVAFGAAVEIPAVHANGFVAAFVAGLVYRIARTKGIPDRAIPHDELLLVDEIGVLTTNFVWFMLGGTTLVAFVTGVDPLVIVLALLALTVLRIGPVYLSLMGSSIAPRDRLLIGALGPRGTASIVFGLLAYNALPTDSPEADFVLDVMVVTVVGSVLLHGVLAPLVLRRMDRAGSLSGKALTAE